MFVIIAAWKNLTPEEQEHPLPVRIGLMLKHAGVAVTVTSITDFVAFGIGATTVSNLKEGQEKSMEFYT